MPLDVARPPEFGEERARPSLPILDEENLAEFSARLDVAESGEVAQQISTHFEGANSKSRPVSVCASVGLVGRLRQNQEFSGETLSGHWRPEHGSGEVTFGQRLRRNDRAEA